METASLKSAPCCAHPAFEVSIISSCSCLTFPPRSDHALREGKKRGGLEGRFLAHLSLKLNPCTAASGNEGSP